MKFKEVKEKTDGDISLVYILLKLGTQMHKQIEVIYFLLARIKLTLYLKQEL